MTPTDQNSADAAVTALAEAMIKLDAVRGHAVRTSAMIALQAIRDDPSLAGFPTMTASEFEEFNHGRVDLDIDKPFLVIPDPPAEPLPLPLPTVREFELMVGSASDVWADYARFDGIQGSAAERKVIKEALDAQQGLIDAYTRLAAAAGGRWG